MSEDNLQKLAENFIESKKDKDFLKLYDRIIPGLKKYIRNFLKNYEEISVDEILSITFYKVITNLNKYNSAWNFSTWVYKIAKNEILMEINNQKRKISLSKTINIFNLNNESIHNFVYDEKYNYEYDKLIDISDNLEEKYILEEKLMDIIREKINCLSDKYRDILIDREFNNLSYEDLAKKYCLPMSTIKSRIFWGRKKLKQMMNKYNIIYQKI